MIDSTSKTIVIVALLLSASCGASNPAQRDGGMDAAALDAAGRDAAVLDGDSRTESDAAAPGCGTWAGESPIRALFVGNSQILFGNIPAFVESLAASAPADCPRIDGEAFARGGANLRDLWEQPGPDGTTLESAIATGGYDVVVITESIDLAESVPGFPGLFEQYARRIVSATRAAGAVPILYASPYIERADRWGFREQAEPQIALGAELDVVVATGGLAWLRVWEELPGADLYAGDRQHPGYQGDYVSASVLFGAITGATPIGLTAMPAFCAPGCEPIRDTERDVFQRAAEAERLVILAR